ncbi:MAG: hypothetical protein IKI57_03565 [Clostridia bacterium]|nr:hypothetical protein [Clostridia bacterium]
MKKTIFILLLLVLVLMTGCNKSEQNETNKLQNSENNQQQEIDNNDINKSFGERIQVVNDYLEEFKNTYGEIHYINWERYISNASLTKNGDYYTMTFSFVSPKLYDKNAVDNAFKEAINNETYEFEEYTFYKDFDSFLKKFESDGYKDIIKEFANVETDSIFVTSKDDLAYIFKPTPNDQSKYVLVSVGLPDGIVGVVDDDTQIDVVLFANDSIIIDNHDYVWNYSKDDFSNECKLTVEEYYNKAVNGETSLIGSNSTGDEYYYKFDNSNIGSTDGYAGYQNALELEENSIIIKLPVQGGI